MSGINRAHIIGNLGGDIKIKHYDDSVMGIMSLFVTESFTAKSGEKKQRTQVFQIRVWGDKAIKMEHKATKGSLVYAEGPIIFNKHENEDGSVSEYMTIDALTVSVLQQKDREKNIYAE